MSFFQVLPYTILQHILSSVKKMLKEWQKIEAAGIFDSLEEFAKYYYENGEKSCFRIITNDPWSKENFFFGTYQELLEFYKTDVSVSKEAKSRIGEKFHYLTILDVFAENKTGKKIVYAKCKCDCGASIGCLYKFSFSSQNVSMEL